MFLSFQLKISRITSHSLREKIFRSHCPQQTFSVKRWGLLWLTLEAIQCQEALQHSKAKSRFTIAIVKTSLIQFSMEMLSSQRQTRCSTLSIQLKVSWTSTHHAQPRWSSKVSPSMVSVCWPAMTAILKIWITKAMENFAQLHSKAWCRCTRSRMCWV